MILPPFAPFSDDLQAIDVNNALADRFLPPIPHPSQMSAKVLIVDDDPVNLTILEDLLHSAGYDIITAVTGTEALEVFVMADPPVQLVLLDVTLPDMSGHEVRETGRARHGVMGQGGAG